MNREPAAIIGTITGLVAAVIALVVAFGLDLTPEQQTAIVGATAVLAPVIATLITRGHVYSPATTDELVVTAARTGLINETTTRRDLHPRD